MTRFVSKGFIVCYYNSRVILRFIWNATWQFTIGFGQVIIIFIHTSLFMWEMIYAKLLMVAILRVNRLHFQENTVVVLWEWTDRDICVKRAHCLVQWYYFKTETYIRDWGAARNISCAIPRWRATGMARLIERKGTWKRNPPMRSYGIDQPTRHRPSGRSSSKKYEK